MRKEKIMDQIDPPKSVEEVLALARYGAGVQASIEPRLYKNPLEPGRNFPFFQLCANYSVKIGGRTSRFEKTYAKGHEVAPARSAANGFMIANTRLHRDVRKMKQLGVKCDVASFVLAELLPGTDLSEFEPQKPYFLDQFALLASIGVPVRMSMTTHTKTLNGEEGKILYELSAVYSILCRNQEHRIETRHGQFPEGAEEKVVARVLEVALYRLEMEQHKLARVGAEISMSQPWSVGKDIKRSLALIKEAKDEAPETEEDSRPSLLIVQG